jgi:hypothetical protein
MLRGHGVEDTCRIQSYSAVVMELSVPVQMLARVSSVDRTSPGHANSQSNTS